MITGIINPSGANDAALSASTTATTKAPWPWRLLRALSPIRFAIEAALSHEFTGARLVKTAAPAADTERRGRLIPSSQSPFPPAEDGVGRPGLLGGAAQALARGRARLEARLEAWIARGAAERFGGLPSFSGTGEDVLRQLGLTPPPPPQPPPPLASEPRCSLPAGPVSSAAWVTPAERSLLWQSAAHVAASALFLWLFRPRFVQPRPRPPPSPALESADCQWEALVGALAEARAGAPAGMPAASHWASLGQPDEEKKVAPDSHPETWNRSL
mmetsp:Transcript_1509/g.3252  ORF Transcript_1509/g.3252 Transcript_1509/m.3252 type:complete len:272 (-) Transcript_1509:45-860(-)